MKILIQGGRVIDPAGKFDEVCDLALAAGRIVGIGRVPEGFVPNKLIEARGCIVAPGFVDLAVRLREPGYEHEGMLESEMAAAVAGGVTSRPWVGCAWRPSPALITCTCGATCCAIR